MLIDSKKMVSILMIQSQKKAYDPLLFFDYNQKTLDPFKRRKPTKNQIVSVQVNSINRQIKYIKEAFDL